MAVLTENTEGELNRRVIGPYTRCSARRQREAGLKAFFDLYAWFMRTTGLKHSERMSALMTPKQVKSDEELADAVEAWERGA